MAGYGTSRQGVRESGMRSVSQTYVAPMWPIPLDFTSEADHRWMLEQVLSCAAKVVQHAVEDQE